MKLDTIKHKNLKVGDVVLVSSRAGKAMPKIHVLLKKKVVVKESKGRQVGLRRSMDWPGYSGWEATTVYEEEINRLRKEWSIPYTKVGEDTLFVYDDDIIKKVKRNQNKSEQSKRKSKNYSKARKNGKKIN